MGFNISYLATRLSSDELAAAYQLKLKPLDTAIPHDAKPWVAELSNGWTIWWADQPDMFHLNAINPHLACKQGQHCYGVSVAEFCMHSSIAKFTPTSKRWSVVHHGDGPDIEHLKVTGKPPKIYDEIRDETLARHRSQVIAPADESAVPDDLKAIAEGIGGSITVAGSGPVDHVFDIPVLLGKHFFGFSYDQVPEDGTVRQCYEILDNTTAHPRYRSLWQRIFKR